MLDVEKELKVLLMALVARAEARGGSPMRRMSKEERTNARRTGTHTPND